ncbi:scavenger receptor class B member 2 [Phyllostomus discolor]|uniref:Scavenger receptor class B member 2 n=1 Tax=Phyllostomus discolor TaxID=89673 RepID=A0A834EXC1_9CHIR|nr:scavenger receptor class B member 2 [Phyllostomus discolor]
MARCCFYAVGTLSLLLLVTSVTLLVARVFQKAVDQTIEKNIVLRNGSETFDSWKKPPLPVYSQFYFFNVTNPEEILRGEIPRLEEVGPYTYREIRDKAEIQFGDNGTTISAVSNKTYVFVRDQSVGDARTDLIRTVNIPAVTAMEWAHQGFTQMLIRALLKAYQQNFFVTHTVHDLLWGYKDELLALIHPFKPDISPSFGLYYGVSGFCPSEPLCSSQGAPEPDSCSLWLSSMRRPKLPGILGVLYRMWKISVLACGVGEGTSPSIGCQH